MTEKSETVTGSTEADAERDDGAEERNHLSDVEAGAGCTEIWEHLSETRDGAGQD
ncbi:hypothetical protein ACOZ4L_08685 [Haloplanus ruber]|uniref:Uncharacterized protein n=1 Tax=Haloplanus ruber TaxID=869892 RepID=A0ABD6CVI4_9EURY|nr:hypothetical protein [Haloplanus ruber]